MQKQREASLKCCCCRTVALNEGSFTDNTFAYLTSPPFLLTNVSSCTRDGPGLFLPPSSLTLSTLIEFSLMFDSSVLSARPPSRCRLPRRFLPPPALASAPVLPISDSLSSGAPSLLYSLSFVCSQMYFCLLLHGPHHKASLRNWRRGPERVEFLIIYSSSTTLEDASPVKTLTILQFKDQKPI